MRLLPITFSLMCLVGCGGKLVKSGITPEEAAMDDAQCEIFAMQATAGQAEVDNNVYLNHAERFGAGFGAGLARGMEQGRIKTLCLKARGYVEVKQ